MRSKADVNWVCLRRTRVTRKSFISPRFAMQLIDEASNRILARNIGTAGGNKQAMQRSDPVFTVPFEIVHERQDRIPKGFCLPYRPSVFLLF